MNIPPFNPKPWVVEVERKYTAEKGRENRPTKCEWFDFESKEEAEKLAAEKTQKFDASEYKGSVREAHPGDLTRQRIQQLAEFFGKKLEQTLLQEESILCYDTYLYGKQDFSPILAEVEEVILNIIPEDQDPIAMGWVGQDGLP